MKPYFLLYLLIFYSACVLSQNTYTVEIMHKDVNTSLRGLCVVNDTVIWTSGSNGYVGRSVDAGKTWDFKQIHPYDSAEFRDIEAFDANTAVVMSSVQPACILKTVDGGKTWKEVFRNDDPAIFLDAFDFEGNKGICLGDPINNWFYLLTTKNRGDSWKEIKNKNNVAPDSTYAFAASGSTIQLLEKRIVFFATGGKFSMIYRSENFGKKWSSMNTAMHSGNQSEGIFSIDFRSSYYGYIGGGDYMNPDIDSANFYLAEFQFSNSLRWDPPFLNPSGYISCIKILPNPSEIIMCGTGGVDVHYVFTKETKNISKEGFNVIGRTLANYGKTVFLAGNNGKIGKLIIK